jgi:hypothetical protein
VYNVCADRLINIRGFDRCTARLKQNKRARQHKLKRRKNQDWLLSTEAVFKGMQGTINSANLNKIIFVTSENIVPLKNYIAEDVEKNKNLIERSTFLRKNCKYVER